MASLVFVTSMLEEAAVRVAARAAGGEQEVKGEEQPTGMKQLLLDLQNVDRCLPDHSMAHALLEWACRSIQADLPSTSHPGVVPGSGSMGVRSLSLHQQKVGPLTTNHLLLTSKALRLIHFVLAHAHSDVLRHYRANMTSVVVRCLRVLTQATTWAGPGMTIRSTGALQLIQSLRVLLQLLSAGSEGFSQEVLRGIVLSVLVGSSRDGAELGAVELGAVALDAERRDARGVAAVLSGACSSIFSASGTTATTATTTTTAETSFSMEDLVQVHA
jgi:hypothetical protein